MRAPNTTQAREADRGPGALPLGKDDMMEMKRSYRILRGVAKVFTPKMETTWAEPFDGTPSVFCPNHAGAMGPVDMCVHFELKDQSHPWFNAAVADLRQMPAYVRQDYWWKPGCKMEWLYNATLPYLGAAVLPPIMRTVPGVPVYHDMQVIKTFRKSIEFLKKGEHLIIFPQQPSGYGSHYMELNQGFLQIAPMAWRTLGLKLKFYPVHISKRTIAVGKPVQFEPEVPLKDQQQRLIDGIAAGI